MGRKANITIFGVSLQIALCLSAYGQVDRPDIGHSDNTEAYMREISESRIPAFQHESGYLGYLEQKFQKSDNAETDFYIIKDYLANKQLFIDDLNPENMEKTYSLTGVLDKLREENSELSDTSEIQTVTSYKVEEPATDEIMVSGRRENFLRRVLRGIVDFFSPPSSPSEPINIPNNEAEEERSVLYAKDQFIIRIKPNLSQQDIFDILSDRNLKAIETYDSFDMLLVELDTYKINKSGSEYFKNPGSNTHFPTKLTINELNTLSIDMKLEYAMAQKAYIESNQNIIGAMSNLSVSEDQHHPGDEPSATSNQSPLLKDVWWIKSVISDRIRLNSNAQSSSVSIGVIDSTFSLKKNAVTYDSSKLKVLKDIIKPEGEIAHGTQVSEIICKLMKKCTVHPYIASIGSVENAISLPNSDFPQDLEQSLEMEKKKFKNSRKLVNSIFRHLDTINKEEGVSFSTVSISLGANWTVGQRDDYTLSPTAKNYIKVNSDLVPVIAEKLGVKQIAVFLSAGNDAFEAKYNSGFHYAATQLWNAAAKDGNKGNISLVTVEAHDSNGKKLPKSNKGGIFTCPSPVLLNHQLSDKKWTDLTPLEKGNAEAATSYSTPVCASAFALLVNYLPDWPVVEILNYCLNGEVHKPETPAIKFDATAAALKCRKGYSKADSDRCRIRVKKMGFSLSETVQVCKLKLADFFPHLP